MINTFLLICVLFVARFEMPAVDLTLLGNGLFFLVNYKSCNGLICRMQPNQV